MNNEEELKEIAAQLRQPHGEKGTGIAHMMNEVNIGMTKHAIQHLHLSEGEKVLELGHGNGGHIGFLLEQAENVEYFGLEISSLMHTEAKENNQQLVENNKAVFTLYNGTIVPFENNFFNKIFTVNTVYFWEEPQTLLAELYRVLKPGKILAITFADGSFMRQLPFTQFGFRLYTLDEMEALIASSSFTIAGIEQQTEKVMSKTGEEADRLFTSLLLRKAS